jgi:hypothetical protein
MDCFVNLSKMMDQHLLSMRHRKLNYWIFSILFLIFLIPQTLYSQPKYGITTTTTVTPPYPITLDGFVADGGTKLSLQIFPTDINLVQYPVLLKLVISGNGITVESKSLFVHEPVYLNGNEIQTLNGSDLEAFFNPDNLSFSGYSKTQYQRNGRLPEGVYTVGFELYDVLRKVKVSSVKSSVLFMFLNEVPMLNLPGNTQMISSAGTQAVNFSWTTRHSPMSASFFTPSYQFEMWEITPEGRNAYEVVKGTRPFYVNTLSSPYMAYGVAEPQLQPGRTYAWRVRETDPEGRTLFKNDGYTEVYTFTYGRNCPAPELMADKIGTSNFSVSWKADNSETEFELRYRDKKKKNAEWYNQNTNLLSGKVENLKSNTVYEVEVCAICGDQRSEYSNRVEVNTKQNTSFKCGQVDSTKFPQNKNPLRTLSKGDVFKAYGFDVEVKEASGGAGTFTGKGYVLVPLLNFIKIEAKFDNVQINEERELIGGEVKTVYNMKNSMVYTVGEGINGLSELNDLGKMLTGDKEKNSFDDETNARTITVDSVKSVAIQGNKVVITDVNGKTEEATLGKVIVVKTTEGKEYVVDTSGEVYSSGNSGQKASGGGTPTGAITTSAEAGKGAAPKYKVTFGNHKLSNYGFDYPTANSPAGNYDQVEITGSPSLVPWKSIETQRIERLTAHVSGGPADSIHYYRESNNVVMTSPGEDKSQHQMMITGNGSNDNDKLFAWYREYTGDTAKTYNRILAGQLNTVSYDKINIKVVLVPIGKSSCPDPNEIQKQLDTIYKSAVVTWNVTRIDPINITFKGSVFDNTDADHLMDYTDDMKTARDALKNLSSYNRETYYLFFIDDAKEIKSYMPLNKQFGFIVKGNLRIDQYTRTIAHELGHGPFRLRHTFSDQNQYYQAEGTTDNLMDYAGADALKLNKYQWDWMHNPEWRIYAFEGEEEGEYGTGNHYCISDNILDIIEQWHVYNTPEPEGESRSFILPANAIPCTFYYGDADAMNGSLSSFILDGHLYLTWYNPSTKKFLGYGYKNEYDFNIVISKEKPTLIFIDHGRATIKHDTYSNIVDIGLCTKYTHLNPAAEALYYSLSGNSNLDRNKLDNLIFYVNSLDEEYAKIVLNRVYEMSGLAGIDFTAKYQVQPLPNNESLDNLLLIFKGFNDIKTQACTMSRDQLLLYAAYYYDNYDFLSEISLDDRICLIKTLSSATCSDVSKSVSSQVEAENYCEKFVISLFKSIKEEDYENFLVKLHEQGLLWKLSHRIDDKFLFFGSDNYKTFCFLVMKYYMYVVNKNGGYFNKIKLSPYYIKWDDDIINNKNNLITISESENKISIIDPNTLKLLKELSIFDIVTIKTINDNEILQVPKNTEIYAPAFFLDYLVFKSAMRDFKVVGETTLDIVSLCTGIGELYAAASVGVKFYRGFQVALAASDLIIKNSGVKREIKSCFETEAQGDAFIKKYETVSMILNSGFMAFDLAVKLPNEVNEFSELFNSRKSQLEENLKEDVYNEFKKIAEIAEEEAKALAKEKELLNVAKKQLKDHGYKEEYADEIMSTVKEGSCEVECAFGIYGCFADQTQVETESGMLNISSVQKGMKVYSYNHQRNCKELKMVSTIRQYLTKSLIVLGLSNGGQIMATPNHPFFVTNKYIEASSLHIGDTLFSEESVIINSIFNKDTLATVYNFTVLDNANYFITNDKILVHNTCFAGRLEKYEHLTKELDKLSPEAKRRFMEAFVNEGDDVLEILNKGNALKAWEKLSELGDTKAWVSKNKNLLNKLSDKDEDFINRVAIYYDKHSSPKDVTIYPSTSKSGIYYDEFGHPDFRKYVPELSDGRRPVYKPDMNSKEVLTGKGSDMTNANNWALKPTSEGGGGFVKGVNFKQSGSGCVILDKDKGWINCTWHHCEDGVTMIPVPVDIHIRGNAAHLGGRQIINLNLQNFFPSPFF